MPTQNHEQRHRCAGCLRERPLRNSHLLPKFVYKRVKGDQNAPVIYRGGVAFLSNDQETQPLLCNDCEQRLNRMGERYASTVLYEKGGDCPLFKLLGYTSRTEPLVDGVFFERRAPVVRGAGRLNVDALTHFALGIFWKCAVTKGAAFSFGPRTEELRQYLFDGAPLGRGIYLLLEVLDLPRATGSDGDLLALPLASTARFPWVVRDDGKPYSEVRLFVCGLEFALLLGNPPRNLRMRTLFGYSIRKVWFISPWPSLAGTQERAKSDKPRGKLTR